jgi:hypothetical protein
MFSRRPEIARHVRSLVVRPDQDRRYGPVSGRVVSLAVRNAAVHLDAMNKFVWDGEEMPYYDDMYVLISSSYVRATNYPCEGGSRSECCKFG